MGRGTWGHDYLQNTSQLFLELIGDIRFTLFLDEEREGLASRRTKANLLNGHRNDADGSYLGTHRNLRCHPSITRGNDVRVAGGDLALDHAIVVNPILRRQRLEICFTAAR